MLHVFENDQRRPVPGGEVPPYLNASSTGLPAAADDRDVKVFPVLSGMGKAVAVPDGLDVTVMASNGFLLSVLA